MVVYIEQVNGHMKLCYFPVWIWIHFLLTWLYLAKRLNLPQRSQRNSLLCLTGCRPNLECQAHLKNTWVYPMSNAISLIFFLKKSAFPSMKTYLKLSHMQVLMFQEWGSLCFLLQSPHQCGGEMGNQSAKGRGCNHMNSATYDPKCATLIFSEICCIEYAK